MSNFLNQIWTFEYALVPCLAAYFVFDFPTLVRRITRKAYVPVYFMFFPFGFTDELYAKYFDEDDLQILGEPLTPAQKVEVRKKIIWVSCISLIFAVVVSPWIAGAFCYFALNDFQFVQFMWTLGIVKSILLIRSLLELRFVWQVEETVNIRWIAVIYVFYLISIITNTYIAHGWVADAYVNGGATNLAWNVAQLLVQDFGLTLVGAGLVGSLVPWRLTSVQGDRE